MCITIQDLILINILIQLLFNFILILMIYMCMKSMTYLIINIDKEFWSSQKSNDFAHENDEE